MSPVDTAADIVPYPSEFAARYREAGYWGSLTIPEELHRTATATPDAPAVRSPSLDFTFAELDRRTDLVALGLAGLGLRPGEKVLLQLTNNAWSVVAWYGLLKAGLVPIATLAQHRRHELVAIGTQADPAAMLLQADFSSFDLLALSREIFAALPSLRETLLVGAEEGAAGVSIESLASVEGRDAEARERVEAIQSEISPEDLAVLQLSGGTTSIPKLIPRLHCEYWFNSRAYAEAIELDAESCVAHLLPVIHNAGIVCGVHAAHSVGACVALCMPDPTEFSTLAASGSLTHMLLVRPLARMVETDPELAESLGTLRRIIWADRELLPAMRDLFETDSCRVMQMFGMGEGMNMVTPPDAPTSVRHHMVGKPICAADEIRIYEPGTEQEAPLGEAGELCCRGPYTIRGYFRAPERNAEAFTADGFYRTGDVVARVEEAGEEYYTLEDRIKDLISRGGEKINAGEMEEILLRHPAVQAAALVAMPDPRLGERACAFLVATPGENPPDVEGLQHFLDEIGVAKFKWPERVEVRGSLPMTNVQKINKVVLRAEIVKLMEAEAK